MALPYLDIERMIKDQHANHVVQKVIEKGYCENIKSVKNRLQLSSRNKTKQEHKHKQENKNKHENTVYLKGQSEDEENEDLPNDNHDHEQMKSVVNSLKTMLTHFEKNSPHESQE
eukprot:CAMPEP_0116983816 /NCGR_PEP_ID=MMETSP0467-20121206/61201_1 /TAXON_ID=283647 /ORGANISM="Mesodinium pulex, Strain SPMC105" /LENGTH=114 /DNA_ID=CAMNT_0004678647 /DNA_START=1064 /DNA_END=1408 /DNA_ORIENTATION=+